MTERSTLIGRICASVIWRRFVVRLSEPFGSYPLECSRRAHLTRLCTTIATAGIRHAIPDRKHQRGPCLFAVSADVARRRCPTSSVRITGGFCFREPCTITDVGFLASSARKRKPSSLRPCFVGIFMRTAIPFLREVAASVDDRLYPRLCAATPLRRTQKRDGCGNPSTIVCV